MITLNVLHARILNLSVLNHVMKVVKLAMKIKNVKVVKNNNLFILENVKTVITQFVLLVLTKLITVLLNVILVVLNAILHQNVLNVDKVIF